MAAELIEAMREIVGPGHVLEDPALKVAYERDVTGRFVGEALAVVRPADADETRRVLAACGSARAPLVVQGGNTGLVGGAVPVDGEIVISLLRLGGLGAIDPLSAQVTVAAGVTLEQLQRHARAAGLRFPVDHAARSAATIGGMVATNAGGPLALRHGTMRRHVIGLELALPDGRVVRRLGGLIKDNAGYDFSPLIVGSEGTLGAITAVRLQLSRELPERLTALIGLASLADAVTVVSALRTRLGSLEAADFFKDDGMRLVCEHRGVSAPFPERYDTYVIVELADDADPSEPLDAALTPVQDLLGDVAVATDTARREALWGYRESHNEAINALGVPIKLDVSVAPSDLPRFEADLGRLLQASFPQARLVLYGHLGDGNAHVNVLGQSTDEHGLEDAVLKLVAQHAGSISAEHGVGRAKVPWLSCSRSADEIALMRSVKQAFDPHDVLGRGRVLPES